MKKMFKVSNYNLDKEQIDAIKSNSKKTLVLASAGSGKTLTLVGKIKYMLDNNLIKKEEICCLSFTNETVINLQKELEKNHISNVLVTTIHKLSLKIIKEFNPHLSVAPESLKKDVISNFLNKDYQMSLITTKAMYDYYNIYFFKSYKRLQKKDKRPLTNLALTFLNLFSSNNFSKETWASFTQISNYSIIYLLYAIYISYEKEKLDNNWLDFDDLITLAYNLILKEKVRVPYKLIIIDEFQDTSLVRFQLIEAIIKVNNASFWAVGDDYQSIYNFAGCDINLIINFNLMYPLTHICKLENTYRNSFELASTANKFIRKNPYQISKEIKSNISSYKPIKIVYYYKEFNILNKVLKLIPDNEKTYILGRNQFSLKNYTNKTYNDGNIRYLTIHKSKGLESDHVILLNVSNYYYGLPNKIKDEDILSLVKKRDNYPYEEERRIFYVALTRTKKDIYLLVPYFHESIFIKELKKDENVQIMYYF